MTNKIKLLVIEDDPTQILLIREALDNSIYEIFNIPDGLEALDYLLTEQNKPDLVLMDYHLPNIDGLMIMNKLKEHNRKFDIIFLTADYSIETAIKSINSGAIEFIPKDGRFVNNIPTVIDKAYQTVKARQEREQFETAFMESEERFKIVMEASKDGIFEWDSRTQDVHVSQNNAQMLNYAIQDFPKKYHDFVKLVHPEDINPLNLKISEHIQNASSLYEAEVRLKTRDGLYKWILERGIVVEKDNSGNPLRVIGTHSDISERKAAEELIIESNTRLTTLISNLPGIVYRYRMKDTLVREFLGGRVEEITGYTAYELLHSTIAKNDVLVHPDDKAKVNHILENAINNHSGYEIYYRIVTKTGNIRWVWDHGKTLSGKYKETDTIEGYFADVTEKKISEEALQQSEEERITILDNSLQAFILINPEGLIMAFNKVANHRFILSAGKSLKKNILLLNYFNNEHRKTLQEYFNKVVKGEPAYWEQPIDIRGEISWYEHVMVPVFISREKIKYVCFTSTDITERKIAEEKILYSESLLNTTINSLNDLLFVVDENLRFLLINEALVRFNKLNGIESKLSGKSLLEVYPFFKNPAIYQDVFRTGSTTILEDNFNIAGKPIIYEIKITPVFQQEKVVRAVTVIRDITERKNFEKRIMNAIIETEERERKRFSEDLHDEMGSILSTIKIYINTLHNQQVELELEKKGELLNVTNQLIDQAIQNSKEIANNLSPNIIKKFGLVSAIQSFCDKLQMSKDINIFFDSTNYNHSLKEDEEISIYRIIIELINNTLKHASAQTISIYFESYENRLQITYSDDGIGFNFADALQKCTQGLGLQNIVSRISSLNGTYSTDIQPTSGFNLIIELNFM